MLSFENEVCMKKAMLTFPVALLSAVLFAAAPTDVYLLIG